MSSVSKTGCLNHLLRNTAVRVHDGEVIPTLQGGAIHLGQREKLQAMAVISVSC